MAMLFQKNSSSFKSDDVRNAVDLMRTWREKDLDERVRARRVEKQFPEFIVDFPQDTKKICDIFARMKIVVQGTQERDSDPAQVDELVSTIVEEDFLFELASTIHLFPFEARKDAQVVFTNTIRWRKAPDPDRIPLACEHIVIQRPEVISALCHCYDHKASIVQSGNMLREALKQEDITILVLYDEPPARFDINAIQDTTPSNGQGLFWQFFTWIEAPSFEISADAFTTFREILTRHKQLVVHWLSVNFEQFFERYSETLMKSQSYVTKRQSIKLLGEILLERTNYPVMTRYVDNPDYLKTCMNLLRDGRKMVQYEGFHVFKVFVANPNKSVAVQRILINNRERLLKFLPEFLAERTEDQQFRDEKAFLIRQIEALPPQPIEQTPR